jgi:hypothetical protein
MTARRVFGILGLLPSMWRAAEVAELLGVSTAAQSSVPQPARTGLQQAVPSRTTPSSD